MIRQLMVATAMLAAAAPASAACPAAITGERTAALIELYTSEGCSSCPPAEAWLGRLGSARLHGNDFVPLALHVPYWDYLGWRDAFAQPAFAQRQSWLVGANGRRTSYTPEVFVSGVEVPDWNGAAEAAIRRLAAKPAAARIKLQAAVVGPDLSIAAEASIVAEARSPRLYLAVTEDHLVSAIAAGENRGATLHHDHVVRALIGPLAVADGRISERSAVPLDPAWRLDRLGVTAFVEDGASGRVLQALATTPCLPGR